MNSENRRRLRVEITMSIDDSRFAEAGYTPEQVDATLADRLREKAQGWVGNGGRVESVRFGEDTPDRQLS